MTYFSLLLFMTLSSAHAWEVGTDVKESGESSSCRLLFRDTANKLTAICSGTLTSPNKITTAGHCTADVAKNHWKTSVECGYQGNTGAQREELTAGGSHVLTGGPKFKETRVGSNLKVARSFHEEGVSPTGVDVGEIEISPPITTIKAVSKAETPAQIGQFFSSKKIPGTFSYEFVPKANVECRTEGYGINGKGTSGVLMGAPLKKTYVGNLSDNSIGTVGKIEVERFTSNTQIQKYTQCLNAYENNPLPKNMIPLAKMIQALKLTKASITPGDSGGPIYCRKNTQSDWQLVGVASTGGFTSRIEMGSTWATLNHPDLIPVTH